MEPGCGDTEDGAGWGSGRVPAGLGDAALLHVAARLGDARWWHVPGSSPARRSCCAPNPRVREPGAPPSAGDAPGSGGAGAAAVGTFTRRSGFLTLQNCSESGVAQVAKLGGSGFGFNELLML